MSSPLVLVVDDDPDIREAFEEALADLGYRVATAHNGAVAFEWLRSSGEKPAMILLDLRMPVMDGAELRRKLLEDPALAPIPVLVLTAHRPHRDEIEELAVDEYMEKPVHLLLLRSSLARLCHT